LDHLNSGQTVEQWVTNKYRVRINQITNFTNCASLTIAGSPFSQYYTEDPAFDNVSCITFTENALSQSSRSHKPHSCPPGYEWEDERCREKVRETEPASLCPDGSPKPTNGQCPGATPPSTSCTPRPGEVRFPDGTCGCPNGGNWDGACPDKGHTTPDQKCPDGKPIPKNGVCPTTCTVVAKCAQGSTWQPYPTCACTLVQGQFCLPAQQNPNGGCCPSGQTWDVDQGCHAPAGGGSTTQCPSGQIASKDGSCTPLAKPTLCSAGQHLENGTCVSDPVVVCDAGTHKENGKCVANEVDKGCKGGQVKDPKSGLCVTPPKPKVLVPKKLDLPKSNETKKTCAFGTSGVYPNCKKIVVPEVKKNTTAPKVFNVPDVGSKKSPTPGPK
jgi:hypothetical protein